MCLTIETWKEKQYRLRAWFAYRYLSQNKGLLKSERFRGFYDVLDRFVLEKYKQETVEATRKGIEQLFDYESEQLIITNEKTILELIDEYENNPYLLQK